MRERRLHVLREPWCKHILLRSELMPGLTHYRVNDVDPGHFILWLALLDKLLDALHHVLVELDGLHRGPGDRGHLRLGDWRLVFVQARELEVGNEG